MTKTNLFSIAIDFFWSDYVTKVSLETPGEVRTTHIRPLTFSGVWNPSPLLFWSVGRLLFFSQFGLVRRRVSFSRFVKLDHFLFPLHFVTSFTLFHYLRWRDLGLPRELNRELCKRVTDDTRLKGRTEPTIIRLLRWLSSLRLRLPLNHFTLSTNRTFRFSLPLSLSLFV